MRKINQQIEPMSDNHPMAEDLERAKKEVLKLYPTAIYIGEVHGHNAKAFDNELELIKESARTDYVDPRLITPDVIDPFTSDRAAAVYVVHHSTPGKPGK